MQNTAYCGLPILTQITLLLLFGYKRCAGEGKLVEEIYEKRKVRLIPPNFNFLMKSREEGVREREGGG